MAEFESCDKCKYNEKSETEYPCNQCVHNATDKFKPMTHADKIRSMSDEELAEFLRGIDNGHEITFGDYFHTKDGDFISSRDDINAKMIQWLQSEAE